MRHGGKSLDDVWGLREGRDLSDDAVEYFTFSSTTLFGMFVTLQDVWHSRTSDDHVFLRFFFDGTCGFVRKGIPNFEKCVSMRISRLLDEDTSVYVCTTDTLCDSGCMIPMCSVVVSIPKACSKRVFDFVFKEAAVVPSGECKMPAWVWGLVVLGGLACLGMAYGLFQMGNAFFNGIERDDY